MEEINAFAPPLRPWLCLHLAPSRAKQSLSKLLQHYHASQLIGLTHQQLQALKLDTETITALKSPPAQQLLQIAHWHTQQEHHLICPDCPDFPPLLHEISPLPFLLYVKGQRDTLQKNIIAIVGARTANQQGLAISQHLSEQLSASGLVIASGLALGIDQAAHRGALNHPGSIAVMATGIDRIYPAKHVKLAEKIQENGAIISEMPLGSPPLRAHFPQRNRIISGLGIGTVLVQAGLKSGSMITARYALEQNREVFALPGSVLEPLHQGCHRLIQQGAKLVTNTQDILDELTGLLSPHTPLPHHQTTPLAQWTTDRGLSQEQQSVLQCIGADTMRFSTLMDATGLCAARLGSILSCLSTKGYITTTYSGYQRVVQ